MKIGIIKEGKIPVDRRTPLTPTQAKEIIDTFPEVSIEVQKSEIRCFSDQDYADAGVAVVDNCDTCDVLLGVKEVPIDNLIPDKTYFFFSHTIKKQEYNKRLLQEILRKNIRLIDYETLADKNGRVIAFGRWAGIVGAYNAIWAFGMRYQLFNIRRAHECFDLKDLKAELSDIQLPPLKIVVTGGGRVAKGAMEVLYALNLKKVTPAAFLSQEYTHPVFVQLNSRDYHYHADGDAFQKKEFFANPERFHGDFVKYTKPADILIASAYWDPNAPILFNRKHMTNGEFGVSVIADITCDIEGSIPSTIRATTIDKPLYDYDAETGTEQPALSDEANVTVMSVDNLPCELPRDASDSFGRQMIDNVLPSLVGEDADGIIQNATIAENGLLTKRYKYLEDFVKD
ncbi:MAG: alanine dehydrogenase [Cyclobacteriaceae bacterium]